MKPFLSFCLLSLFTLGASDPYEALEQNSITTCAWVEQQREKTELYLSQIQDRSSFEERLREITDFAVRGLPEKRGESLYYIEHRKGENKKILVSSEHGILVNPNSWDNEGALTGFIVDEAGERLAYGISYGGSDLQEWRVVDLVTGDEYLDSIQNVKFSKPCFGEDCIYYAKMGKAIYRHSLEGGETCLYQPGEDVLFFQPSITKDQSTLILPERFKESKNTGITLLNLATAEPRELISQDQGEVFYVGDHEGTLYFITDAETNYGKLISFGPDERENVVIREQERLLNDAALVEDKLVVSYYKNACAQLEEFDLEGNWIRSIPLPSGKGSVNLRKEFYVYTDFVTPPTLYTLDSPTPLFAPEITWNPDEYVTEQVWFTSRDGTQVPMFLVHRKGVNLEKVLQYGYGGFGTSLTPYFRSYHLAWIENGGVFALPNIRGGREFGAEWYAQGRHFHKQNCFDDFIAATEWLKAHGASHISILGSSNGGLLTGACLTQRPDLFDVVIVNKGVLDMLRYHLYTVGRFWMSDYGNPDDPVEAAYLLTYSPYHNIVPGTRYPPTLVNTADHDDRVVPMHSYKFAASLQEANSSSNPILLRLEEACGHGGSTSLDQEITFGRDMLSFIFEEM